jgi:hypothetical protein
VWILVSFAFLLLLLLRSCLRSLSAADLFASSAFSCSLAAASADAAACALALACCFFYSRIALSFTIKAALYNASVMLSGE